MIYNRDKELLSKYPMFVEVISFIVLVLGTVFVLYPVIHELGHALAAFLFGGEVVRITVFPAFYTECFIRPDQFGCYDFSWRHAAVTNGAELFRQDGRASHFADVKMEETLRFMMDLRAIEKGREVTARDFDTGKVAFRPFTFAEYRTYKPYPWRIKKYTSFEWDCIKLPAGPSGRNTTTLGTLLVGISERSSQKELAWKFLKRLCYDYAQQQVVLKESQGLSPRGDIMDSEETEVLLAQDMLGQGRMDIRTISDVMDEAVSVPKFKRYEGAMLLADNEIRKILNGSIPFHNALNKLQKEVNAYLQY